MTPVSMWQLYRKEESLGGQMSLVLNQYYIGGDIKKCLDSGCILEVEANQIWGEEESRHNSNRVRMGSRYAYHCMNTEYSEFRIWALTRAWAVMPFTQKERTGEDYIWVERLLNSSKLCLNWFSYPSGNSRGNSCIYRLRGGLC